MMEQNKYFKLFLLKSKKRLILKDTMHTGDVLKYTDTNSTPRKTRCDIAKVETPSEDEPEKAAINTGLKNGKNKISKYIAISPIAIKIENK